MQATRFTGGPDWSLAQQMEGHDETGENDGYGGTQLDEDVQGGAGGVLEGIAHGVAHDSGLVALGALAAVVAGLDVLLGVVPGAAGVGHEHGHGEAGDGHAAQQAHHAHRAEDQAGASRAGTTISWRAPLVHRVTQRP